VQPRAKTKEMLRWEGHVPMMPHSIMDPIASRLAHGSVTDKTVYSASARKRTSDPSVLRSVAFAALMTPVSSLASRDKVSRKPASGSSTRASDKIDIVTITPSAMPVLSLAALIIVQVTCPFPTLQPLILH